MQEVAWIAGAIGTLISFGAICFTVFQYYQNTKVNRAKFWLDLRTMFAKHEDVHVKLKPGSDWGAVRTTLEYKKYLREPRKYRLEPTDRGPSGPLEWASVDAYMGLFELCEMMLRKKLIDEDMFKSLYKYRLGNLMWNKKIVNEKITGRAAGWKDFNKLLNRFDIDPQVRDPKEELIGKAETIESQGQGIFVRKGLSR